jgi:integrase
VRHKERQEADKELIGEGWVDQRLICCDIDGGPISPDWLSNNWRNIRTKAGVDSITFHDLRHAHATLLLVSGLHPKIVSERLGHSTIGITYDLYSHVTEAMQEEAADRIDEVLWPKGK